MIRSFRDRETELIWREEFSLKLPHDIQRIALRKLIMLHKSFDLKDLQIPPSNHLEKLHGNRAGLYSIRINDQWRICFKWDNGNADDVQIVDYH